MKMLSKILQTKSKFRNYSANTAMCERFFLNEKEKKWKDVYQIDRDRIFYSKAFHRLGGKTQVFQAGYDDHIRNRLTHTLAVCRS